MNSNILTIVRKELARFFRDRRMVISALLLPGIMIYAVYTVMGTAMKDLFMPDETHIPVMNTVNLPDSIDAIAEYYGFQINEIAESDINALKSEIKDKKTDILAIFPPDFDAAVAAYVPGGGTAPDVLLYYKSTNPDSDAAYSMAIAMFADYESSLSNKFDINFGEETPDLASDDDKTAFSMSSMMPFLMMIFMFSSCMSLAPESIAGEKERGTIATILVTPIRRSELAVGKILSLGLLSFLCGLSSCIGTFLSLPKMMQFDSTAVLNYGFSSYLTIALVVLTSILLIVAVISIISAFAKTVKEATTSVAPLMIVVMLIGITSMFGSGATGIKALYLIPLYNSVQAMVSVFGHSIETTNALIAILSNFVYACAAGFILTRMFNSEKIIFNK